MSHFRYQRNLQRDKTIMKGLSEGTVKQRRGLMEDSWIPGAVIGAVKDAEEVDQRTEEEANGRSETNVEEGEIKNILIRTPWFKKQYYAT